MTNINNSLGNLNTIITNTNNITTTNNNFSTYTITKNTCSYNVFGKEVVVDGDKCPITSIYIATLNTLGIKFYNEFKKQNVSIAYELQEFIENNILQWERERKLNQLL
jgi:hypothetical protein